MSSENRSRLKQWLESGEAKLHPATLTQRELWETNPILPGDGANNICTVTKIRGAVSRDHCEKAMAMVVEKQEVLRLSILPGKNGPVQLVRKQRDPAIHLSLLEGDDMDDAAVDALIEELIQKPFDLVAGPLYRVEVIRRSPEEHLLVLVIHHAIGDGWTLGVFMTDLWTGYALLALGAPGGLEPVPQSYSEWGAAERAFWQPQEIKKRRTFWIEQMEGAERIFQAPEKLPENPGRRGRWAAEVPGEVFEETRALAAKQGSTLFSTALAAFQIVMAHATGKDDILVGCPVANRNKKASWDTMGSYAGIVPFRGQVDRGRTFLEQLADTHQMTVDSIAHALPFVELVKCLGEKVEPGRNPVFDVRFALQNHPVPDISMPGMEVEYRTRSTGTSRFDLACELTEFGSTMEVVWLYREDMFSPSDAKGFHDKFITLLARIYEEPESLVSDLIQKLP